MEGVRKRLVKVIKPSVLAIYCLSKLDSIFSNGPKGRCPMLLDDSASHNGFQILELDISGL